MNLEERVKWAENILAVKHKHGRLTEKEAEWKRKFQKNYGWVNDCKRNITLWRAYLDILSAAKEEIKQNGLSRDTYKIVVKKLKRIKSKRKSVVKLKGQLIEFLKKEGEMLVDSNAWLGTSDIIESVFGKYKVFSARTPLKEIGKSVLTIPVFTSQQTLPDIKRAMETISDKMLREWLSENIGESLLARRKRAFSPQKQKNV